MARKTRLGDRRAVHNNANVGLPKRVMRVCGCTVERVDALHAVHGLGNVGFTEGYSTYNQPSYIIFSRIFLYSLLNSFSLYHSLRKR